MQPEDLKMQFIRQMYSLAATQGCTITDYEVGYYANALQRFGLRRCAEACLEFQERGYPPKLFPTIEEFENLIIGMGLVR